MTRHASILAVLLPSAAMIWAVPAEDLSNDASLIVGSTFSHPLSGIDA